MSDTPKPREFWIEVDMALITAQAELNQLYADNHNLQVDHDVCFQEAEKLKVEIERLTNQYNEQLDLARHRAVELEKVKHYEDLYRAKTDQVMRFSAGNEEYHAKNLALTQELEQAKAEVKRLHDKYDFQHLVQDNARLTQELEQTKEGNEKVYNRGVTKGVDALQPEIEKLKAECVRLNKIVSYEEIDKLKLELEQAKATLNQGISPHQYVRVDWANEVIGHERAKNLELEAELERAKAEGDALAVHCNTFNEQVNKLTLMAVLNRDKLLKAFAVAIGVKDASGWSTGISILKELGFEDEAEWVLSEQGEKE